MTVKSLLLDLGDLQLNRKCGSLSAAGIEEVDSSSLTLIMRQLFRDKMDQNLLAAEKCSNHEVRLLTSLGYRLCQEGLKDFRASRRAPMDHLKDGGDTQNWKADIVEKRERLER